jgi:hypothetical protein
MHRGTFRTGLFADRQVIARCVPTENNYLKTPVGGNQKSVKTEKQPTIQ